jgi:hypothetical protein
MLLLSLWARELHAFQFMTINHYTPRLVELCIDESHVPTTLPSSSSLANH